MKSATPAREREGIAAMRLRKTGWIIWAVILGLMVYACISLLNMRSKVTAAAKTEAELQKQATQLQEENAALEYAVENQNDPDTVEDIARSRLGLVMPDEIIFYDAGE